MHVLNAFTSKQHYEKMKYGRIRTGLLFLCGTVLLSSCSLMREASDPYGEAWEEVVASRGWKAAVDATPPADGPGETHYAIPNHRPLEVENTDPEFLRRYPAMVSRAYFRLISEAMDADRRVSESYQDLYRKSRQSEGGQDPVVQQEFETARRRFLAHREMLEGLRSWNAFNEYGSDDLDFFLQEQLEPAYEKYERGVKEEQLVDYLMRRLADLYHLRYGGVNPNEFITG